MDTQPKKDDDNGIPGLGGSGAVGGVASGGTSKKTSVRGGDNSKGGSSGVGSEGKFMERG